jgi:hypothetical protein
VQLCINKKLRERERERERQERSGKHCGSRLLLLDAFPKNFAQSRDKLGKALEMGSCSLLP